MITEKSNEEFDLEKEKLKAEIDRLRAQTNQIYEESRWYGRSNIMGFVTGAVATIVFSITIYTSVLKPLIEKESKAILAQAEASRQQAEVQAKINDLAELESHKIRRQLEDKKIALENKLQVLEEGLAKLNKDKEGILQEKATLYKKLSIAYRAEKNRAQEWNIKAETAKKELAKLKSLHEELRKRDSKLINRVIRVSEKYQFLHSRDIPTKLKSEYDPIEGILASIRRILYDFEQKMENAINKGCGSNKDELNSILKKNIEELNALTRIIDDIAGLCTEAINKYIY